MTLILVGCQRGPAHCAVCDRAECQAVAFRVTLPAGRKVETCCARCGLHYLNANSAATRAEATDFPTGHWMDAGAAYYVSGSDVHPCASMKTQRDAQGCCVFKGYDRCLPSLVAFANEADARSFARQNGGTVTDWKTLTTAR